MVVQSAQLIEEKGKEFLNCYVRPTSFQSFKLPTCERFNCREQDRSLSLLISEGRLSFFTNVSWLPVLQLYRLSLPPFLALPGPSAQQDNLTASQPWFGTFVTHIILVSFMHNIYILNKLCVHPDGRSINLESRMPNRDLCTNWYYKKTLIHYMST